MPPEVKEFIPFVLTLSSDNFEFLLYLTLALTFLFGASRMLYKSYERIPMHPIVTFCLLMIIVGETTLIGMTYWVNYLRSAVEIQISGKIEPNTAWVKSDFRIYYVHDHQLRSQTLDGKNSKIILTAAAPIREYQFSPDGKKLLVSTNTELFLLDPSGEQSTLIDQIRSHPAEEVKGTISGVRWAPDSQKFCYEKARWSKVSSQENLFIYNLSDDSKGMVRGQLRRVSPIYWDNESLNLYYIYREAHDTSQRAYAFDFKVFRISASSLEVEMVARIPYEKDDLPLSNLEIRGIQLFLNGDDLVFNLLKDGNKLTSEKGSKLGIDQDDHLYFIRHQWFKRRLFKITRRPAANDFHHQYKGGELMIKSLRWIPGGRYAVVQHMDLGNLVLEPSTGKLGYLAAYGSAVGWPDSKR
jgi:hypothetical protein